MKTLSLLAAAFVLVATSCGSPANSVAEADATIVVQASNATPGDTLFLTTFVNMGNEVKDLETAIVNDGGKAFFGYQVTAPGIYRISMNPTTGANLVLEPGDKPVFAGELADFGQYTVTGSEESNRYQRFNQARATYARDSKQGTMASVQNAGGLLMRAMNELIHEKPASLVSLIAAGTLLEMNRGQMVPDWFDQFNQIVLGTESFASATPQYQALNGMIAPLRAIQPGSEAPEILLNDPDGNPVALSSLRGKVVLIDFWASWCKPCRKENPNVVRMYNEYKDKGFEVYSVSLDRDRNKWVEAIAADGLTWTHVSDLAHWNSIAAKKYAVHSIPATFLIDKDGIIIDRGLRGPALEAKLAEVING